MLSTSKVKWIGTIFLAGIVLGLALMGGKWGTTYAADASVNAPPIIYDVIPDAVPAGSPDKTVTIYGANFGNLTDTAVRVKGTVVDTFIIPISVIPEGLSFIMPAELMVDPTVYLITVVKYSGTIPTIPPFEESNPWVFTVYDPIYTYLPFAARP